MTVKTVTRGECGNAASSSEGPRSSSGPLPHPPHKLRVERRGLLGLGAVDGDHLYSGGPQQADAAAVDQRVGVHDAEDDLLKRGGGGDGFFSSRREISVFQ